MDNVALEQQVKAMKEKTKEMLSILVKCVSLPYMPYEQILKTTQIMSEQTLELESVYKRYYH